MLPPLRKLFLTTTIAGRPIAESNLIHKRAMIVFTADSMPVFGSRIQKEIIAPRQQPPWTCLAEVASPKGNQSAALQGVRF